MYIQCLKIIKIRIFLLIAKRTAVPAVPCDFSALISVGITFIIEPVISLTIIKRKFVIVGC